MELGRSQIMTKIDFCKGGDPYGFNKFSEFNGFNSRRLSGIVQPHLRAVCCDLGPPDFEDLFGTVGTKHNKTYLEPKSLPKVL